MLKGYRPKPLFDTCEHVQELYKACRSNSPEVIIAQWVKFCLPDIKLAPFISSDFQHVLNFLYCYRGGSDTFNAYRRELERFLHWSWFVCEQSIASLSRYDIEAFIEFCKKPPKTWVGLKTVARFKLVEGMRVPNNEWHAFNVKVSKKAFQDGVRPEKAKFELSQQGVKVLFAVLGSFYNFLIQEEVADANPVVQIRQKSKFIQKKQQTATIRRLSQQQWNMVIQTAEQLAIDAPDQHERTLFIMNALYGMYLRISELASSQRWSPTMGDFFRDANQDWWFKTVGKGNKARQIAVSDSMLNALKRWRKTLGLSAIPSPDEQTPLLTKLSGTGPITSTRAIRQIVQLCFDTAVNALSMQGEQEEAEQLRTATVHWLRHTGISDDVKQRPREHVRDDAGHSSSAITDKYIDIELQARHNTAKGKLISEEES